MNIYAWIGLDLSEDSDNSVLASGKISQTHSSMDSGKRKVRKEKLKSYCYRTVTPLTLNYVNWLPWLPKCTQVQSWFCPP